MDVQKGQEFIETQKLAWTEVGPGVRRKITAYDDSLMTVYVEFQKGAIGYLHKHPHRQISFIESGKFEVHIGEKMQILSKGDFYYIPPGVEHGVTTLEAGLLVDIFTPAREDFLQTGKK
jgi:quercetin dioxygenase-like cupin family protein